MDEIEKRDSGNSNVNNNNVNVNVKNVMKEPKDEEKKFNRIGVIATVIGTIVAIIALIVSLNKSEPKIDDSFKHINNSTVIVGGD